MNRNTAGGEMTRMMNLTAALGLGALMVMGPGCSGDKDAGSDSSDSEADADADTDSDSDTDTEPTYFEDYAVFMNIYTGYDGFDFTDFYIEPGGDAYPPYVVLTFAEEEYFEDYDDSYTCEYVGLLAVEEPLDLGVEDAWLGYKVALAGGQTDCTDFDPARFGLDGTPVEAVESLTFGIGFGPLTADLETTFEEVFDSQGADWATEGKPYFFTGYLAFSGDGGTTFEAYDFNYAYAFETDDDMVVIEEDGTNPRYDDMDSAVELPYPSLIQSNAAYGLNSEALFP
jgi:hypothetical protein